MSTIMIDKLITEVMQLMDYADNFYHEESSLYWKGHLHAYQNILNILKMAKDHEKYDYKCQCGSPVDENAHCIVLMNKDR